MLNVMEETSAYHEEGWRYDLTQVRGCMIALCIALASFAVFFVDYLARWGHGQGCTVFRGGSVCGGVSSSIASLFAYLTGISGLIAVVIGAYTATTNTHRVRGLAWVCAGLSTGVLVGFIAFIVVLSL